MCIYFISLISLFRNAFKLNGPFGHRIAGIMVIFRGGRKLPVDAPNKQAPAEPISSKCKPDILAYAPSRKCTSS